MKPGIYSNAELSNEAYHASEGISSTALKELIARSPAHCRAMLDGLRRKGSAAMSLGTVIHSAVLEPETFWQEYWLAPDRGDHPEAVDTVAQLKEAAKTHGVDIKGKTKKDDLRAALVAAEAPVVFWDDLNTPPAGRAVLSPDQAEVAAGVVQAIQADPEARHWLSGGVAERSYYWRDEATGELCKVRHDYYQEGEAAVVDLKTCEDARPDAVAKSIYRYGYDVSAAMYLEGAQANGKPAGRFIWVFAETKPPYAVRCYEASPEMLARAGRKFRAGLDQYSFCRMADSWPGYPSGLMEIDLPGFALKSEADDELEVA